MFVEVSVLAALFAKMGGLCKLRLLQSSVEAGGNLIPSLARCAETSVKELESHVTHEGAMPVAGVGSPLQFTNTRVGFADERG